MVLFMGGYGISFNICKTLLEARDPTITKREGKKKKGGKSWKYHLLGMKSKTHLSPVIRFRYFEKAFLFLRQAIGNIHRKWIRSITRLHPFPDELWFLLLLMYVEVLAVSFL